MINKIITLRPPRIAAALMLIAGILYWTVPVLHLTFWSSPLVGSIFAGAGFVVMLWAWAEFRRFNNPICPTARAATMIRSGPFRVTRNPMYLGMLLMLLSPSIWLGSPFLLLPALAFFGIMSFIFIPYEESRMELQFQDGYKGYRTEVRRWV